MRHQAHQLLRATLAVALHASACGALDLDDHEAAKRSRLARFECNSDGTSCLMQVSETEKLKLHVCGGDELFLRESYKANTGRDVCRDLGTDGDGDRFLVKCLCDRAERDAQTGTLRCAADADYAGIPLVSAALIGVSSNDADDGMAFSRARWNQFGDCVPWFCVRDEP